MWLEIIIALLSGIAGLAGIMGLGALLGTKFGGYFGPPLFIMGLTALLVVVAYHLAIKPQVYVVVSQGSHQLLSDSQTKTVDANYIVAHPSLSEPLDINHLVSQLQQSEKRKQCQYDPSEQLEICVSRKGWW